VPPASSSRSPLEEELLPARPPVVGAGNDLAWPDDLDRRLRADIVDTVGVVEDDPDLARPPGIVRGHRAEIRQSLARALLDQLGAAVGGEVARAEAPGPLRDGDGGEPAAEQRAALVAGDAVAGDEHDRAAPVAAERRVDPDLPPLDAVEGQRPPLAAGHG